MQNCSDVKKNQTEIFVFQILHDFMENCHQNVIMQESDVSDCLTCSQMKTHLFDAYDVVLSHLAIHTIEAFEKAFGTTYCGDTATLIDAVRDLVEIRNGEDPHGISNAEKRKGNGNGKGTEFPF